VTAAAAGCPAGTGVCAATPSTELVAGLVRWEVKAWSAGAGHGPWSVDGWFTAVAPTLIAPANGSTTTTLMPTFQWSAVAGATEYYLWVYNGGRVQIGQWFTAASAGCGAGTGTCSVTPTTALTVGPTRWQVKAWSAAQGHGPWSADGSCTVLRAPGLVWVELTWGATPSDLDSHLMTPSGSHIYFGTMGSCSASPWACLDVDDVSGYGPENTTIQQMSAGIYHFAVYNFSGTGSVANARIRVYSDRGLIREWVASAAAGTNRWWYVFDLDGTTGGITEVNTFGATWSPKGVPIPAAKVNEVKK
jgi:hypothetical protein